MYSDPPFSIKTLDTTGQASQLTVLYYAFSNVVKQGSTYKCVAGDVYADYARVVPATESVDGIADTQQQKLRGSWNQIKKLKQKFPELRVIMSIGGGGPFSKQFSRAAKTTKLRKALVTSCVKLFLKGNVPVNRREKYGGSTAAARVFDGLDVDWEFPGRPSGSNYFDAKRDKQNHVLLLKEFRKQMDALAKKQKRKSKYLLTVAINGGNYFLETTDPRAYSAHTDWINLMSYDFAGEWQPTGPTNFQSNLVQTGSEENTSTKLQVDALVALGVPTSKIMLGVPFYGRGWTGVAAGPNTKYPGFFQPATSPLPEATYAELKNMPGKVYFHSEAQQTYKYDGNQFWTFDTPQDVERKVAYCKEQSLGGVFAWSANQDDGSELTSVMAKVLN